jgi:hypothetical protein
MSATKPGQGLASPDSRRRSRAKRSRTPRVPLFDSSTRSAGAAPADGTHRVPDPQPAPMLELELHREAPTETWWESFQRAERALADRLAPLWQMTPAQRVAAMRSGELTYEQLLAWTRRHPDQVPTVHGEYEWIVAKLPEVCE